MNIEAKNTEAKSNESKSMESKNIAPLSVEPSAAEPTDIGSAATETDVDGLTERFLRLRRAHIEKEFLHLNPMQREAVLATEGPLLILAGAGSGKTTVLINRIYNLMKYGRASDSDEVPCGITEAELSLLAVGGEEADRLAALDPVAPWQILAITFTNKAAGELKDRLERMLGEAALDIWACTFHAACLRILRRDCDRLGFTSGFSIYDTNDSVSLLRHILKDMELDDKHFPPKAVLAEISRAKDRLLGPENYRKNAEGTSDLHKIKIASIYQEYQRRMRLSDSMDFDDLIFHTVQLLDQYEDLREYWQRRFRYVLIDEYQDTNTMQYRFSELISGGRKNICVVGDDDQSIYKFRGATIENILTFEEHNPGCRTVRLEQNYRSTGNILQAANAVIRNNMERKGKELWTDRDAGDRVELFIAGNENEESQYVVSKLLAGYTAGESWRNYAVLYRKNAQSNSIEFALKRNGIPYRIVGGTRFFDRAEVKDILSYMSVISTPEDDLRLERIINNPPRGIGAKSVESARSIAAEEGKTLYEIISHADTYPDLSRPAARMREFANMIAELRTLSAGVTPDMLFDQIIERTGYIRMLQEKNTQEEKNRIENVQELKSTIIGFMKESGDNTLSGYLANVALYTDLDNYDTGSDAVTMMTMHSSKGLEFPHVFIIGMEENLFPCAQAIGDAAEMEEERRLCYVALTRAMKTLHLVCARQRMFYGQTSSNRVSRFVGEIPEENLHIVKASYGHRYSSSAGTSSGSRYSDSSYNGLTGSSSTLRRRSDGFSSGSTGAHTGYPDVPRTSGLRGLHGTHASGLRGTYSGRSSDRLSGSSSGSPSGIDGISGGSSASASKTAAAAGQTGKADIAAPSPVELYHEGDRIRHKAFHEGTIVSMKPMGGDFLIEISFDQIGSKKLMLKAAVAYMEKL